MRKAARPRGRTRRVDGRRAASAIVMILGVSGAIAALGDTLFPARSLAEGLGAGFRPGVQHLRAPARPAPRDCRARRGVAGLLRGDHRGTAARPASARLAAARAARPDRSPPASPTCCCSAPVWMQMVHLLLADALWISLVLLCAGILESDGFRPISPCEVFSLDSVRGSAHGPDSRRRPSPRPPSRRDLSVRHGKAARRHRHPARGGAEADRNGRPVASRSCYR